MSKKILKAAVAGLGRIAWSCHLPNLQKSEHFEIIAVCDPLESVRNEAMKTFDIPQGFADLDTLLAEVKPDLLVIATPTCFHTQHAVAALKAGCHVFCDKPAAMNQAGYREMLETAQKCNRVLEIFQPRRFNHDSAAIREIIASGVLGKVYQLKVFCANYVRRNDWQAFKSNGGGMLFNYGSHYVDQCISLFGRDYKLLGCSARRILSLGDADDVVKLLIDFNGIEVDIDINQAAAHQPYFYTIYGEYGSAELSARGRNGWKLRYYDPADAPETVLQKTLAAEGRAYPRQNYEFKDEVFQVPEVTEPGAYYYENLYRAITANEPLINPPEDTLTLTGLLDAAEAMAAR